VLSRHGSVMTVVLDFLTGNLRRRTLVALMPAIFLVYFGTLAVAAWFAWSAYDWRHKSISWLLYPRNNPEFHLIASIGIALTGVLLVPTAGYIRTRLTDVSIIGVEIGASIFRLGAILLVSAGLIVSHPYAGTAAFPRMHETLARGCALALGAGMLMLWISALRAWFNSTEESPLQSGSLLASWSLVVLPAILVIVLRLLVHARLEWSNPIYRVLANRSLWHLGFWEWIGSAAVFLFLLSSVLFLPSE
jgi:hypothetical protein